jgi:hypothetical protein
MVLISEIIKNHLINIQEGHHERSNIILCSCRNNCNCRNITSFIIPNIIGFNVNNAIFFLVSGIAQIFWVLPMVKRWGKIWYYLGIAGTIILIIMWVITRMPGNPITGRGGPISEMAIAIEVFQIAYIIITGIIIAKERRGRAKEVSSRVK